MNFCKRNYQLILRYLYTEAIKRQGEISLHKHFNSPNQMAETFNTYFSNVGSNLSDEIPSSVDSNPEDYLDPTDGTFSLQFPSVNTVTRLLKTIDEKNQLVWTTSRISL